MLKIFLGHYFFKKGRKMKKIILAIIFSVVGIQTSQQASQLERIVLVIRHLSTIVRETQQHQRLYGMIESTRQPKQKNESPALMDPLQTVGMRTTRLHATAPNPEENRPEKSFQDPMVSQGGRVMPLSHADPMLTVIPLKQPKKALLVPEALEKLPTKQRSPQGVSFVEFNKPLLPVEQLRAAQPAACPLQTVVVPVLGQGHHAWPKGDVERGLSWSKVAAGEGGHCGYHALKNVVGMMQILENTRPEVKPDTKVLTTFENYRNFMTRATPIINTLRADLSWLDGGVLEILHKVAAPRLPILIVENVPVEGLEFHEDILLAVQRFARSANGMLGFVWNSGVRDRVGAMGGIHWVGFVAAKDAECITLYSMDSGGGSGMYTNNVINLLSLTPAQIDEILARRELKHAGLNDLMQNKIEILKKIRTGTLQEFINDTWMEMLAHDERFPDDFQREILILLAQQWARASAIEKDRFRALWQESLEKMFADVDKAAFKRLIGVR